jgi:hypothetical protein
MTAHLSGFVMPAMTRGALICVLFYLMGITQLVFTHRSPAAATAKIRKFGHLGLAQVLFLLGLLAAAAAGVQFTGIGGITQVSLF